MSQKTVVLSVPAVPPSLNKVGASGGWRSWQTHKKLWQHEVEMSMLARCPARGWSQAFVDVELRFPKKRRRDRVNFQSLLDKSIGDALVNGRWIPDDTPDEYEFRSLRFDPATGEPLTRIIITLVKNDGESGEVGAS